MLKSKHPHGHKEYAFFHETWDRGFQGHGISEVKYLKVTKKH